ncbi:hypothetical protein EJB05_34240, partial [Eragrostis curvula]
MWSLTLSRPDSTSPSAVSTATSRGAATPSALVPAPPVYLAAVLGYLAAEVWLLKRREGQQQNPHHRVPHPPSNPQGQGAQKPPGWRHHPPRQCSAQHPPRGAPQEGRGESIQRQEQEGQLSLPEIHAYNTRQSALGQK